MPAADDLELMQHADHELDEAADHAVELRIGRDADAKAKVEAIGELGELVRGHLELATDAVPARRFDAMWREIDKQLDLAAAAAPAVAPPVREPAASESVSVMMPLPERASLRRRAMHWLDRKRGYVLTAMISAGAVAAIALVAHPGGAGGGLAGTASGPLDVTPVSHHPTELESLDTPGGTGTVMRIQDEDGDTTVIWVTPEDTVEGI